MYHTFFLYYIYIFNNEIFLAAKNTISLIKKDKQTSKNSHLEKYKGNLCNH